MGITGWFSDNAELDAGREKKTRSTAARTFRSGLGSSGVGRLLGADDRGVQAVGGLLGSVGPPPAAGRPSPDSALC
jgi:hypothetical protein